MMQGNINDTMKKVLQEVTEHSVASFRDALHQIWLFGSQAKGTSNEDSDVDIMVVLKHIEDGVHTWDISEEVYGDLILDIMKKYNELLAIIIASASRFDGDGALYRNVKKEGVLVYGT